jgi:hypothetical protein
MKSFIPWTHLLLCSHPKRRTNMPPLFSSATQTLSSSSSRPTTSSSSWTLRPACLEDADALKSLLERCYGSLLVDFHTHEVLEKALPLICQPSTELMTCGTWYVVSHPTDPLRIVGCGGWTLRKPGKPTNPYESNLSSSSSSSLSQSDTPFESSDNSYANHPAATASTSDATTTTDTPMIHANLRHFATDPEWLRRGIARAIWDRCQADVGYPETADHVTWHVYSSLAAPDFYASLGFQLVTPVELPLSDDCIMPCLIMIKEPLSSEKQGDSKDVNE